MIDTEEIRGWIARLLRGLVNRIDPRCGVMCNRSERWIFRRNWEATSEQMYNAKELNPQDFHDGSVYVLKVQGDSDDYEMYFDRVETSFGKRIPQLTTEKAVKKGSE